MIFSMKKTCPRIFVIIFGGLIALLSLSLLFLLSNTAAGLPAKNFIPLPSPSSASLKSRGDKPQSKDVTGV
ncbi:hypothetical protein ACU8KH_03421 [Lachancea thermotolerans]